MAVPGHLVDSNILLRIARRDDPDHAIVDAALARLLEGGAILLRSSASLRKPSRNSLALRRSQRDKALPCPSEQNSDFFPRRSPLPPRATRATRESCHSSPASPCCSLRFPLRLCVSAVNCTPQTPRSPQ